LCIPIHLSYIGSVCGMCIPIPPSYIGSVCGMCFPIPLSYIGSVCGMCIPIPPSYIGSVCGMCIPIHLPYIGSVSRINIPIILYSFMCVCVRTCVRACMYTVCIYSQTKMKPFLAQVFAMIHSSVAVCSKRMLIEMRRHNYVTPTNFLELVEGYKQ